MDLKGIQMSKKKSKMFPKLLVLESVFTKCQVKLLKYQAKLSPQKGLTKLILPPKDDKIDVVNNYTYLGINFFALMAIFVIVT